MNRSPIYVAKAKGGSRASSFNGEYDRRQINNLLPSMQGSTKVHVKWNLLNGEALVPGLPCLQFQEFLFLAPALLVLTRACTLFLCASTISTPIDVENR